MITCNVCELDIDNGVQFVAVPDGKGLLVNVAHANCAPQDHKFDGAPSYTMNPVRAGVIANHILKANS